MAEAADQDHFARPDFQAALDSYDELERSYREGGAPPPPDVNEFLQEQGLAPPSGRRLVREDIIWCPPGYHPVPVGDQSTHRGGPPFCTCEPL